MYLRGWSGPPCQYPIKKSQCSEPNDILVKLAFNKIPELSIPLDMNIIALQLMIISDM